MFSPDSEGQGVRAHAGSPLCVCKHSSCSSVQVLCFISVLKNLLERKTLVLQLPEPCVSDYRTHSSVSVKTYQCYVILTAKSCSHLPRTSIVTAWHEFLHVFLSAYSLNVQRERGGESPNGDGQVLKLNSLFYYFV